MQKKPSGLGRGLGDLLEDNSPQIRENRAKVVVRQPEKKQTTTTADIYEQKPKNRSVKANYR